MRGKDTSKAYTYAISRGALGFRMNEEEQLCMLQTLPGFLQHCDAGARFFIEKHLSRRTRGKAWFREQIAKRIRATAKRYGHILEAWVVDELLEAAMEYLQARSSRDLGRLLVYVSQGQDMTAGLVHTTKTQPNSTAARLASGSCSLSCCCSGLLEICA